MATNTQTLSWYSTAYTADNVNRRVPRTSGVYLVGESRTNGWTVIYVGRAEDLRVRLLSHLQPSELNSCLGSRVRGGRAAVWWASVALDALGGVEKYVYDHYRPVCNQAIPGGWATPVNLP